MIAQYIRVSTIEQNIDRQKPITGAKQYIDRISGTCPLFKRPMGKKLYEDIENNIVKELHVPSIDRLGRNTLDILNTINYLNKKGICLVSEKEGIRTLIDGKENLTSKLVVNILATLAEFENNIRKERQAEGIAMAKLKGTYTGRKRGTKLSNDKFLEKHKDVLKELKKGESIRRVAKLCNVSTGTVQKVKKIAKTKNL